MINVKDTVKVDYTKLNPDEFLELDRPYLHQLFSGVYEVVDIDHESMYSDMPYVLGGLNDFRFKEDELILL
ncbi:hypothetical protein [Aquibacillus saliphilus]|uniref:hypothetical protein n=1 Tax=Aquibacillus saliphilus TaxID=1909422 RepID=UPI001CEFE5AF|nr:hypothetical protein [Aquibacillus saliphilus]